MNVLFVSVENAGRSQMAEALFTFLADGRHNARSAGTAPAERVHPEAVWAMAETGIDLSDRVPRELKPADIEWADVVVTVDREVQAILVRKRRIGWSLDDPAGKGLLKTRWVRDEIALHVFDLVRDLDESREGAVLHCILSPA